MAARMTFPRVAGSAVTVFLVFAALVAANAQSGWQSIDAGPTTPAPAPSSGGGWTAFDGVELVRNKDAAATERMLAGLAILLETTVAEPGVKAVHGKRLQGDLGSVTEVRGWLLGFEEYAGSTQGADARLAKDLFAGFRGMVEEAFGGLGGGGDLGAQLGRLGASDGPDIGSILGRLGGSNGFGSALGRLGGSGGLGSVFGPAMSQITQALQQGNWQDAVAAVRRAVASMRQRRATRTTRPQPPPPATTPGTARPQPPVPQPPQRPTMPSQIRPGLPVAPSGGRPAGNLVDYWLLDEVNEDALPHLPGRLAGGPLMPPFLIDGDGLHFGGHFIDAQAAGKTEDAFALVPGSGGIAPAALAAVVEHRVTYQGKGRSSGYRRFLLVDGGGGGIPKPAVPEGDALHLAAFQATPTLYGLRFWKSDLDIRLRTGAAPTVSYAGRSHAAGESADLGSAERSITLHLYQPEADGSGMGSNDIGSRRFTTRLRLAYKGRMKVFVPGEDRE